LGFVNRGPLGDLEVARVHALLETARFGRSLRIVESTESTNDDARRDALTGAADGHVVVADSQRSGRGSHGRVWVSPAGQDLYLSIVARPPLTLTELSPLTLAVGLGVAQAVERVLSGASSSETEALVKWPNDVRIGGKKCAGILVEASSVGAELGALVIGIGLNINRQSWPDELQPTATSLLATCPGAVPFDRARVLAELLFAVEHWVDRFTAEGGAPIAQALQTRLAMRGEPVRCGGIVGTLVGVAPTGAVRIATGSGLRELIAGRLESAIPSAPE
jgi:BirA family transcriptional regulator, biotin operon repressor / biotin---[acetyl-CoA-carboxylase] ligase